MEFTIENGVLTQCVGNDEQVFIPEGVTRIGAYYAEKVFDGCPKMKSIAFPHGLLKIGDGAFKKFGDDLEIHVASLEDWLGIESWTNGMYDPRARRKIYIGDKLLTEVVIPEGTTIIKDGAFRLCKDLATVKFPDSLTEIGFSAFSGCASIRELAIPDGVKTIGARAFAGCAALEKVKLPKNLEEIKQYTFANCSSLKEIELPDGLTKICERAFENCDSLASVTIPETVKEIEEFAFLCKGIREVTYNPDKTKITEYCSFREWHLIERINIPGGIKTTKKVSSKLIKMHPKLDDEELAYIGLYQGDAKWKEWFYDRLENDGSKTINNVAAKIPGILKSNGKTPKPVQDRVADFMAKFKKKIKPENAQAIQECFGDASTAVQKTPKKEPKQLNVSEIIQKGKTRTTAWFEKRGISPDSFSEVKVADGADVSAVEAAMFVMYEYGRQMQKDPAYHAKTYKSDYVEVKLSEDAEKVAALLDKESLKEAIRRNTPILTVLLQNDYWCDEDPDKDLPELYPGGPRMLKYILNNEPFTQTPKQVEEEHENMYTFSWGSSWEKPSVSGLEYFLPYARFANSQEVSNLVKTAENLLKNWVIPGRTAAIAIRSALLLNNTKEAMDYLEKYNMLEIYAKMRGVTVSALRSKKSKTSLKADGTMSFDL